MDSKAFNTAFARALGVDSAQAAALTDAIADEILTAARAGESVSIPGFGQFLPLKTDEFTAPDPASGRMMLYPPKIELRFRNSVMLRKNLRP